MWFVYIVECSDGSYYTGITNDVDRRINEHNTSKSISAKYTRQRRPVKLMYKVEVASRAEALKTEAEIKKLSREKKRILIMGR